LKWREKLNREKENEKFEKSIDKQTSWLVKWRKKGIIWEKVMIVGAIGWMVVLPMVIGGYLGNYLDKHNIMQAGDISWTMTFILLGLIIAIYSVWRVFFYKR